MDFSSWMDTAFCSSNASLLLVKSSSRVCRSARLLAARCTAPLRSANLFCASRKAWLLTATWVFQCATLVWISSSDCSANSCVRMRRVSRACVISSSKTFSSADIPVDSSAALCRSASNRLCCSRLPFQRSADFLQVQFFLALSIQCGSLRFFCFCISGVLNHFPLQSGRQCDCSISCKCSFSSEICFSSPSNCSFNSRRWRGLLSTPALLACPTRIGPLA